MTKADAASSPSSWVRLVSVAWKPIPSGLNERNVSRRHARLVRERDIVFAEDLDSYNGLFVNGGRVAGRRELHTGDVIRIGDFQLGVARGCIAPRSR